MATSVLDVNRAIADSLVNVSQSASQGIQAGQIVDVQCDANARSDRCISCVNTWRMRLPNLPLDAIQDTCAFACSCNISDVDLGQVITANFSALLRTNVEQEFWLSFIDNLSLQASRDNLSLGGLNLTPDCKGTDGEPDETCMTVRKMVNAIYARMTSDTVQQALQSLSATQIIRLQGPGSITAVSMQQMINMVSAALQTDAVTRSLINDLQTTIIQDTQQVLTGTQQIIIILVVVIAFSVICTIVGFSISWLLNAAYAVSSSA